MTGPEQRRILVEPYPHHVEILFHGHTLADSHNALLLIETHAPDIYLPFEDIDLRLLTRSDKRSVCPYKGEASYWSIEVPGHKAQDAMWAYEQPLAPRHDIAGHAAFYFDRVETRVDGERVRGHVRDPHKVITVRPLAGRLRMELGGIAVVDTERASILAESGLPERFYVPPEDVAEGVLQPSPRRSVCTYKGEASYRHLAVPGEAVRENAVWSYPRPWTDFSADLERIAGCFGFYASTFERVTLDGRVLEADAAQAAVDRRMRENPTVDAPLAARRAGAGEPG